MLDEGFHASSERLVSDSLTSVQTHIDRAVALLDARGRRIDDSPGARRVIERDTRPAALIRPTAKIDAAVVEIANAPAHALGIREGEPLPKMFLSPEGRTVWADLVCDLDSRDPDIFAAFLPLAEPTPKLDRFAITKTYGEAGSVKLRLSTPGMRADMGALEVITKGYALTRAESAILADLVSGLRIKDIATKRARGEATVRNQVKSIFAKSGRSSQSELVSLFAAITELGALPADDPSTLRTRHAEAVPTPDIRRLSRRIVHTLPDGRALHCDLIGPERGRPVLAFNSILTGNSLTAATHQRLYREGLQLIMPWRPGWERSDALDVHKPLDYVTAHTDDILHLLDHLGLQRVQALGIVSGSIFAYALAQREPSRIPAITVAAPVFPLRKLSDLRARGFQQQLYMSFARYAPSLVDAYCRFALAKMDAGFDREHAEDFFRHSADDLATSRIPEIVDLLRDSFAANARQGAGAISMDLRIESAAWAHLFEIPTTRIDMLVGATDPACIRSDIDHVLDAYPNMSARTLAGAGNLLVLQKPDAVIDTLLAQWALID